MTKAAGVADLSGDLDLTETVVVVLDGDRYVVDLTPDEAKELRNSVQPFIAAARVLAQEPDESIMLGNWETEYEGHIGYAVPEFGDGVTALEWRDAHTPRDQVLVDNPDGFRLTVSTRPLADAIGWRVACLCGGLGEPLGDDWAGPLIRRTTEAIRSRFGDPVCIGPADAEPTSCGPRHATGGLVASPWPESLIGRGVGDPPSRSQCATETGRRASSPTRGGGVRPDLAYERRVRPVT